LLPVIYYISNILSNKDLQLLLWSDQPGKGRTVIIEDERDLLFCYSLLHRESWILKYPVYDWTLSAEQKYKLQNLYSDTDWSA
jgi:hypothetical protein